MKILKFIFIALILESCTSEKTYQPIEEELSEINQKSLKTGQEIDR